MINIIRNSKNPIFYPNPKNPWESKAAFNGSVVSQNGKYEMLYRAVSQKQFISGAELELSIIGRAESNNGLDFSEREIFTKPTEEWEKFGCEDPRVTFLDNEYFVFYTALSGFPPSAGSIKIGLAISDDLKTVKEKHPVTPFNSKAMALFPEKINGKYYAVLTANTDNPPSQIAIASFNKKEDIWSKDYWEKWYNSISEHALPLQWSTMNQIEVGAVPVKTPYGWLVVYCDIKNYFAGKRTVQIKAVLLDLNNPEKIIGKVDEPLLVPQTEYESKGEVPDTIFPTSVVYDKNKFLIYYGATDTNICVAEISEKELYSNIRTNNIVPVRCVKFKENPIIQPLENHEWEKNGTFNPTAVFLDGKVHIIYRAMSGDNTSTFGYAVSSDGIHIDERLPNPIYVPREDFELKKIQGANSGCEDPRITIFDDLLYVCYTAYTGEGEARVALTSISVKDFLARKWKWEKPILVTAPGIYDKDACIFPEKIGDQYLFFHRITPGISVDYSETLKFCDHNWLKTQSYIIPRPHEWDDEKIGIGATPIKTPAGWLLIYHGISKADRFYRVGAMLMDLGNPQIVTARTEYPILEPDEEYEKTGGKGIAFPCGNVVMGNDIYIYYGGADKNVCVAKINKKELLDYLVNQSNKKFLKT